MKSMKVCLGGTFDVFHKGHKYLVDKALSLAGRKGMVFIGVTSDKLVGDKRNVKPVDTRVETVKKYLSGKNYEGHVEVGVIDDRFGPAVTGDFDAIVVSPETSKVAEEINEERKKLGRKKLEIHIIPFVMAKNGKTISATRIKNKEIDENGDITTG